MSKRGFSLISVLIAIVMLSIGILALARTTSAVVRANAKAATRTEAVSVARAYMEDVRSRDPTTLASEVALDVDGTGQPDPNGPYRRQLIIEDVAHNLKRVRVVVTMPRSSVPVELVTLAFVGSL